jgi:hypothetical protein
MAEPREVACDESGSEGEKLVGGNTDVFAHASVRVRAESAADCVQELRARIRSPALEYKANHLLREKNRSALVWLLGRSGPIHGTARVYLTDKTFFLISKVIELLTGQASSAAVTLYRAGRDAFGHERWRSFLECSNDLLRARSPGTPVDSFFHAIDALRGTPGAVDGAAFDVIARLWQARPRAESLRAQLLDNPQAIPPLDLLAPAIVRAVIGWGEGGTVVIVHDENRVLTEERVAQLKVALGSRSDRLAGLRLVDSRADPRVQVADFLAGVARKIASDELNGRADAELTALLGPYVDPHSVWLPHA